MKVSFKLDPFLKLNRQHPQFINMLLWGLEVHVDVDMSTRGQQVSEAVALELLRPGCLRWRLTSSLSKLGVSEREARATQCLATFYNADKISGLDSLHMNLESLCIISDLGNQISLANSYVTSFI